jgi:tripartite-type tricarboxylate transporter receptor subunit TctC
MLVWLLDLTFLPLTRGNAGRNVKFATLAALALYGAGPMMSNAADSVADFYRGKTITLLVPSGPGGGYDTNARLVGRFIGEHIRGKPNIVVQNMPGGGGLTEVNYLYNIAPKDGSVIAIIMHGTIFDPIFNPREVRYKIDGFRWLGSVTPITVVGGFRKDAPAHTVAELFDREVIIGGSGGTTVYLPLAVNSILHTKMKLVKGYGSTNNIMLAMARREISGVVGIGLDTLRDLNAGGQVTEYNILFQLGVARGRTLPDVPLIQEFAKSDEDREVLATICASCSIGWVFVTPSIPDDRYAALQTAFEETLKDPAFLVQAQKQHVDIGYVSPNEIQKIVGHVYSRREAVLKRVSAIMMGGE